MWDNSNHCEWQNAHPQTSDEMQLTNVKKVVACSWGKKIFSSIFIQLNNPMITKGRREKKIRNKLGQPGKFKKRVISTGSEKKRQTDGHTESHTIRRWIEKRWENETGNVETKTKPRWDGLEEAIFSSICLLVSQSDRGWQHCYWLLFAVENWRIVVPLPPLPPSRRAGLMLYLSSFDEQCGWKVGVEPLLFQEIVGSLMDLFGFLKQTQLFLPMISANTFGIQLLIDRNWEHFFIFCVWFIS